MAALPLLITYLVVGMNVSMQQMNFQKSSYNVMQGANKLTAYSDNNIRNSQFCQTPLPILDQLSKPIINNYLNLHRPEYQYGNASVNWRVLRYNESGHFVQHKDRHRPVDGYVHIGTEIYLPPYSELQFQGGELVVENKQKYETIKPHDTKWTHIIIPLDTLHKVNKITGGTRISYTKPIYMQNKLETPQNSYKAQPNNSAQL